MTRNRISPNRSQRRGFTLIELLVVISIIAVLASLIAPAVQNARRTARKLQCLNNIRQIGIAMQAFSTSTGGSLPYLTQDIPNTNANGTGVFSGAGWPMQLLPALDATAILKNIKANATLASGYFSVAQTEQVWLGVFTCPDDLDSDHRPGGLSYVANAGFIASPVWGYNPTAATPTGETPTLLQQPYLIDWTGNSGYSLEGNYVHGSTTVFATDATIQTISLGTGVFFRATGANTNSFQPSLDAIATGDGMSSTLMLTENLNAGPWYATELPVTTSGSSSYLSNGVNQMGFGANVQVNASYQPLDNTSTATLYTTPSATYWNKIYAAVPDGAFINRNLATATIGSAPRPSSQHAGGVNVIMCDGSGKYLADGMDKTVYLRLLTSNGVTFGEATVGSF